MRKNFALKLAVREMIKVTPREMLPIISDGLLSNTNDPDSIELRERFAQLGLKIEDVKAEFDKQIAQMR